MSESDEKEAEPEAQSSTPPSPPGFPEQLSFSDPRGASAPVEPIDPNKPVEERVVDVLKTIFDPEIPVNIYELGLVYEIEVNEAGHAKIVMTLTSPNCPVAESLPAEVEQKVRAVEGVHALNLELTWEPPWGMEKMSEAAKLTLGMV